jgi:hypothetical protein
VLASLAAGAATARAEGLELVPSVGLQRAVKGGNEAKPYDGLALRTRLAPALKAEIGAAYRRDEYASGDFAVKSWPITASLWLSPLSPLYVGGGVGWYNTTVEFAPALGMKDETRQDFGMHVGGGLPLPLAPPLGLDLNGRYILLPVQEDPATPKEWNPSYWSTTLGLSLRF